MCPMISREFRENDKYELNDSYNRFTDRSRTIEQFEWEWLNTPEGQGSIWILEDSDSGKIVGAHGLIPIPLTFSGKSILAGKTENTHIHPPYAGKGLYYPFEVRFIEESKARFDLLYTTQGRGAAGKIRLKLGYTSIGGYATYMKAIKKSSLDKLLASMIRRRISNRLLSTLLIGALKVGSIVLMPFFTRKGALNDEVKLEKATDIDTVAEEIDKFWERNKEKFGITADRNSRYLKWRIFDNPNLVHEFFLARKRGEMFGYAIVRSRERAGAMEGRIVDLIADDNNEVIFNSILNGVQDALKERGVGIIHFQTLFSNNTLNKAIRRNGYINISTLPIIKRVLLKKEASQLMTKALSNDLDPLKVSNPACWYFTDIFFEGVQ